MLSFIDISGDLRKKPTAQPFTVAASVTIRKRRIAEITAAMHRLKRDILRNETIEVKSTSLINRDTLEFPEKHKARYLEGLFGECIDQADCYYSAVVIPNQDVPIAFTRDRLAKHNIYLLQRIQRIAVRQRCDSVVVVLDNETRKVDKWAAYAFNNYLYRTANGQELDRILPVPIFADSEMTGGIQLADIVASVIRKYYSEGLDRTVAQPTEDAYVQRLREYFGIIRSRSTSSSPHVGIYRVPDGFLERYYAPGDG